MWKKLDGKIIKFLFYMKKNFIRIMFKLSVLTTMLILVYLVCVLQHSDAIRQQRRCDASHPIEISQKLKLTVATESTTATSTLCPTTEFTPTFGNIIPNLEEPFPIQKQTSTQATTATAGIIDKVYGSTTEAYMIPTPGYMATYVHTPHYEIFRNLETTTTTEKPTEMPMPSLEEYTSTIQKTSTPTAPTTTTTIPSTTTQTPEIRYTTLVYSPETTTEVLLTTTEGLFMDNWAKFLHAPITNAPLPYSDENEDSQVKPKDNIFHNEDDKITDVEVPLIETKTNDNWLPPTKPEKQTFSLADIKELTKHTVEELVKKIVPLNLSNTFHNPFDHVPAASNNRIKKHWQPVNNFIPYSIPHNHAPNTYMMPNGQDSTLYNYPESQTKKDNLLRRRLKYSMGVLGNLFGKLIN